MDYKITPFTADTLSLLEKNEPCSPDFYILPSYITASPCSEILSDKAKLLYGMMYTTMKLNSVRNGWIDKGGALYIDFPVALICSRLNCSQTTAKNLRKELRNCFGNNNGLVRFVSRGQGNNDHVYVMNYHSTAGAGFNSSNSLKNTDPISSKETNYDPSRESHFCPSKETHFCPSRETKSDPYIIENNKERDKRNDSRLLLNSALSTVPCSLHAYPFGTE